jgi:mRNA-degrading endonuclease RelE of RelBE toxin-antitoxin system
MHIRYTKAALKTLAGYDKQTRERIKAKIIGLTYTPAIGDIKPLTGTDSFRLRVGKYRIKYYYSIEQIHQDDNSSKDEKILQIVDADSRGDIYK